MSDHGPRRSRWSRIVDAVVDQDGLVDEAGGPFGLLEWIGLVAALIVCGVVTLYVWLF